MRAWSGCVQRARPRGRRRGVAVAGLLALGLLAPAGAVGEVGDFTRAGEAYLDGRYDRAARLYEGLEVAGWRCGELYFNLGNAYYQSGRLGEAIRAYRRAEAFWPRDRDLAHNLEIARSRVRSPESQQGIGHALRSLAFWYELATVRELGWSTVALWCATLAALAVRRRQPGGWRTGVAAGAAVLLVVCGASWLGKVSETRTGDSVVLVDRTEVRAGPGPGESVLGELTEGAEVRVLGSQGGYHRVRRSDGREGWLRADAVGTTRLTPPPGPLAP